MKKKLLALVLAATMVFGTALTVSAAGTGSVPEKGSYTITIDNKNPGHTYEAYQIFSGNVTGVEKQLFDIQWGTGITDEGKRILGNPVDKVVALDNDSAKAAAFADEVARYLVDTPSGKVTVSNDATDVKYEISGLEDGYYLVMDKVGSLEGTADSYTKYILEVVNNVKVTPKSATVTFEKKVQDINDSTDDNVSDLQDSADYDIGDDVPYTLTGTLPENYAVYNTYYYAFHDTMDAGLTYNKDAKITVGGVDVTNKTTVTADDHSFKIEITDLKTVAPDATKDSKVVVTFTATLNSDCVRGNGGNVNDAYLEFSNNPNGDGHGETKHDKVIVFTYKAIVNKVDPEGTPLAGAEFEIYKILKDGTEQKRDVAITAKDGVDGAVFTVDGIDDGIYKIVETKAPDGYNAIEPIYFKVIAEHAANIDLVESDKVLSNLTAYQVTDGTLSYADMETGIIAEFTPSLKDGSVATDIENRSGALLPSTGGIGTTIFYVVGGILVVGAGIVLFAKKRTGYEEE